MRYLDVCAGISASTVAWKPLGWEAAAYSEIEAAPRAVLSHHYPDTPLHGDFTTIKGDEYGPIDLLVGGTPCQDFSVAGLRAGLGGDRGNLSLQFLLLAARTRARWVVWENVPGVFSSLSHDAPDPCPPQIDLDSDNGPEDGEEIVVEDEYDADESHALGCFLAGLQELGYGVAYRVLDAQFAGVPQRRRRIFAVGYLGDWRRAAAVLFERHSLSGHPAPSREAGQNSASGSAWGIDSDCLDRSGEGAAGTAAQRSGLGIVEQASPALRAKRPNAVAFGGGNTAGSVDVAACLVAKGQKCDFEVETFITHALRGEGFDASEDGTGRGTPLVPVPFDTTQITSAANYSNPKAGDPCHPLAAGMHPPAVAFAIQERAVSQNLKAGPQGKGYQADCAYTLEARHHAQAIAFDCKASGQAGFGVGEVMSTLRSMGHKDSHTNGGGHASVQYGSAVRRLTPRECERLQGFPDDYTLVPHRGKPMADGPRYKALGNSMAVPVMAWIGQRIVAVEALTSLEIAA
jgi:DNA (cytosine-5)-methyltransferase 1